MKLNKAEIINSVLKIIGEGIASYVISPMQHRIKKSVF